MSNSKITPLSETCQKIADLGISIKSVLVSDDFDAASMTGTHEFSVTVDFGDKGPYRTKFIAGCANRHYPKSFNTFGTGGVMAKDRKAGYRQGAPIVTMARRTMFSVRLDAQSIPNQPNLSEVMHCLLSEASFGDCSHREFCDNMELDPDSISGRKMWEDCLQTNTALWSICGGTLIRQLTEILEDY